MKIGIAMLPDAQTSKFIVDLQEKVMPICPLRPRLGTDINLPHITLLQGRFKNNIDWVGLLSDLRELCLKQKYSLEFKLAGLEYKLPGWYFLTLSPIIVFSKAHNFVFDSLKNSMLLTDEDRVKNISDYTSLEKYNYLKYGYRYIGDAFHPHITLGRITDTTAVFDKAKLIHLVESDASNIVGKIERITIYEMGENGSHATMLYYLDIGSPVLSVINMPNRRN